MVVLDGMLDGTSVKSIPDAIQVVLDTCGSKVIPIVITVDVIIISATTEKFKFKFKFKFKLNSDESLIPS